jgi:hypothetical protein
MSNDEQVVHAVFVSDLACACVLQNNGFVPLVDDSKGRNRVRVTEYLDINNAEEMAVRIRKDVRRFRPEPKVTIESG